MLLLNRISCEGDTEIMIIRTCIGKLGKLVRKIRFKLKLRRMDHEWYISGACGWQLFPPSFYYTHTPEEIERIRKEALDEI